MNATGTNEEMRGLREVSEETETEGQDMGTEEVTAREGTIAINRESYELHPGAARHGGPFFCPEMSADKNLGPLLI